MDYKKLYRVVGAEKLNLAEADFIKQVKNTMQSRRSAYGKMEVLDKLLETFGIEYIVPSESKNGCFVYYLNVGDPYVPTVVMCEAWVHPIRIAFGGYADYVK